MPNKICKSIKGVLKSFISIKLFKRKIIYNKNIKYLFQLLSNLYDNTFICHYIIFYIYIFL